MDSIFSIFRKNLYTMIRLPFYKSMPSHYSMLNSIQYNTIIAETCEPFKPLPVYLRVT